MERSGGKEGRKGDGRRGRKKKNAPKGSVNLELNRVLQVLPA